MSSVLMTTLHDAPDLGTEWEQGGVPDGGNSFKDRQWPALSSYSKSSCCEYRRIRSAHANR